MDTQISGSMNMPPALEGGNVVKSHELRADATPEEVMREAQSVQQEALNRARDLAKHIDGDGVGDAEKELNESLKETMRMFGETIGLQPVPPTEEPVSAELHLNPDHAVIDRLQEEIARRTDDRETFRTERGSTLATDPLATMYDEILGSAIARAKNRLAREQSTDEDERVRLDQEFAIMEKEGKRQEAEYTDALKRMQTQEGGIKNSETKPVTSLETMGTVLGGQGPWFEDGQHQRKEEPTSPPPQKKKGIVRRFFGWLFGPKTSDK